MRFEDACTGWQSRRMTQEEAVRLLGVCERTFRRYVDQLPTAHVRGAVHLEFLQNQKTTGEMPSWPRADAGSCILQDADSADFAKSERRRR